MNFLTSSPRQGTLHSVAFTLLRIVSALLFIQHGTMKLFGVPAMGDRPFTGPPPTMSQFWWAGVLELVGGTLVALGLFTRPVAFLLSGEMAVAYFQAHLPNGMYPATNGGEASALFCFLFLYFFAAGAGPYSADALLFDRGPSRLAAP